VFVPVWSTNSHLVDLPGVKTRVTSPAADEAVAALARRQHGAVSIGQLRAAGLGPHAVSARMERGWLRRLHRGVYAVGALESSLTRPAAALLAAGDAAALSHRTAAVIWGVLPERPADPVDITLSMPGVRSVTASGFTTPS
jgi:predicted transcriptional regulator of viral defense system